MAQHNPGARAFLLIVLGGIVIGFVIAAYLFGGDDSETGAKMDQPASETTTPDNAGASEKRMPPEPMPAGDTGMSDGVTPPDEMMDDTMPGGAMPDAAPDAIMPEQSPEDAAPESPPPAPNP